MSDLIAGQTGIKTLQVEETGEHVIIDYPAFMLRDLIISNHSNGFVTVLAKDVDGHEHVVVSLQGYDTFNHKFSEGWRFWQGARLYVVKESDDGFCNVSLAYMKTRCKDYSVWGEM